MFRLSRLCRSLYRLTGRRFAVNRLVCGPSLSSSYRYQVYEGVDGVWRSIFHAGTIKSVERFILDQFN